MRFQSARRFKLRTVDRRATREPDLTSLINIVFLILIFFIVAGTLRPFSARDIELTKVAREATAAAAPSRLVIDRRGRIFWGATQVALSQLASSIAAAAMPGGKPLTIVADGRAPGSRILEVARELRRAGVKEVTAMVERGQR